MAKKYCTKGVYARNGGEGSLKKKNLLGLDTFEGLKGTKLRAGCDLNQLWCIAGGKGMNSTRIYCPTDICEHEDLNCN